MKQPLFIKNAPINEKRLGHIERVISRLARRQVKTARAMITPYPISSCDIGEDVKGDVLKYMFVSSGIITKGMIQLGEKPKKGALVNFDISNDQGGQAISHIVKGSRLYIEPNMRVFAGDRLTISISSIDPEYNITECWIAFLWMPNIHDVEVRQFLLDEILRDENVEDRNEIVNYVEGNEVS